MMSYARLPRWQAIQHTLLIVPPHMDLRPIAPTANEGAGDEIGAIHIPLAEPACRVIEEVARLGPGQGFHHSRLGFPCPLCPGAALQGDCQWWGNRRQHVRKERQEVAPELGDLVIHIWQAANPRKPWLV